MNDTDTTSRASMPAATPMMAQYMEIRAANPGVLLFYRMGDFYELFFDDAEIASRALGITLTRRGQHLGEDIPMCGVPVHAAEDYLHRLIRLGHKVAVCEQLEDPAEARKRGAKSVVRRDVVRLVTPGTLTEDKLLEARRANYLASLVRLRNADDDNVGLAWLELSTGAFFLACVPLGALAAELARIDAREILISDALAGDEPLRALLGEGEATLTPLPRVHFDSIRAERTLCTFFGIAALDAFGSFERAEIAAAGALIAYVDMTQVGQRPAISPPRHEQAGAFMAIDPATRANLELMRTLQGAQAGSLLAAIDRTVTPPGARLLADDLAGPLTDPRAIDDRLDAVGFLVDAERLREDCRAVLKEAGDMARSLQRLSLMRGGPRDLEAIRAGLDSARGLARLLEQGAGLAPLCNDLAEVAAALAAPPAALSTHLGAVLADELPLAARDGGFVRAGYDQGLDDTRALRDDSRKIIAGLQSQYAALADVKALRIKFNNVLGYFIEVSAQHGARLMEPPLAETFIHRQTLANVMRFSTVELAALQARIAEAGERAIGIELDIFARLREELLAVGGAIKTCADALARLDVQTGLATLAVQQDYRRPRVDTSLAFRIEAGRHPVVEQVLKREAVPFIANDCDLGGAGDAREDAGRLWLLTGPNMAGKSTFLRQNALIAILAQIGSFVPARAAHIGIVDRLFSRVGAADDLARGRSTFMVEMVETAAILNQAGPRALVILDEIGRGTATFDGLSIAWASIEHLHEINRSRALFATHYHELTSLAGRLQRIVNATVKVREWDGEVIFLHEVVPGSADRSYGIQVARLAGLPASVVARAKEVLDQLEAGDQARAGKTLIDDLPLFSVARAAPPARAPAETPVADLLRDVRPDELSPREALDLVYALKLKLDEAGRG